MIPNSTRLTAQALKHVAEHRPEIRRALIREHGGPAQFQDRLESGKIRVDRLVWRGLHMATRLDNAAVRVEIKARLALQALEIRRLGRACVRGAESGSRFAQALAGAFAGAKS